MPNHIPDNAQNVSHNVVHMIGDEVVSVTNYRNAMDAICSARIAAAGPAARGAVAGPNEYTFAYVLTEGYTDGGTIRHDAITYCIGEPSAKAFQDMMLTVAGTVVID